MKRALLAALMLLTLALPTVAAADDGNDGKADEARVRVACAGGRAELRVKLKDDEDESRIEIELRVDTRRAQSFRIVLLHERTLVFTGVRRTTKEGTLRLRRTVADWPWRETLTARIGTASGRTCVLEATL